MENYHDSNFPGRIEENGSGFGVASPEQIEQRARELVVISGRPTTSITDADRNRARCELLGESLPDSTDEEETLISAVHHWDEAPGTIGHKTQTHLLQDETSLGEQLINEGMAEALHDEMLEAAKKHLHSSS
jgi:hypothetical protein